MKEITESFLQSLQFAKSFTQDIEGEYYYDLEIGSLCFISNTNLEALEKGWTVELFDHQNFSFRAKPDKLVEAINLLKEVHNKD